MKIKQQTTLKENPVSKRNLDLGASVAISESQTKAQILDHLADCTGISKKDVQALFVATYALMQAHLTAKGSGQFVLPELGIKIKRHLRPATKERQGRNPLTGEAIIIKAKPECTVVKLQAMKKLKEAL